MKAKFFFDFSICITLIIIILGCAKNADNNQNPDNNLTEAVEKADSVVTHSGNGRLEVSWLLKSDANLQRYKINCFSNAQSRTITNTIQKKGGRNIIHVIIDGLNEGKYRIEIFMLDAQGKSSAKVSSSGVVYGPQYQSTLINRDYNIIKREGDDIELKWKPASKDLDHVEIIYQNSSGTTIKHIASSTATLDTLQDVAEGHVIKIRSAYLPNPTAIDTFYTDYLTALLGDKYSYTEHYDPTYNTFYYLTRIPHLDNKGQIIKLRLAHTIKREGETVWEFADRTNSTLAFNASTQIKFDDDKKRADMPSVVAIVDGNIINNSPRSNRYTLGIKDDNELMVFTPGTSAQAILNDGVTNAITAFVPLILNHQEVSDNIINYVGNLSVKNPRQIISQWDNLDILFLTTGGRGYGGDGMTAKEAVKILQGLNVKFSYNLDGGGSTSTVVNGEFINWKMDKHGTQERKRPTFLYIK